MERLAFLLRSLWWRLAPPLHHISQDVSDSELFEKPHGDPDTECKGRADINSQQYEELSKNAVNAIKQVCLGVKGVPPQELTELLQAITDAPLDAQYRCELRDLFNQKLSNDPSLSSTELVKVHFPENYLRTEDWNTLMDSGKDVSTKLLYLATLWANLGLVHPSEKSSRNIAALGVLTEQEVVIAGPWVFSTCANSRSSLKPMSGQTPAASLQRCTPALWTSSSSTSHCGTTWCTVRATPLWLALPTCSIL